MWYVLCGMYYVVCTMWYVICGIYYVIDMKWIGIERSRGADSNVKMSVYRRRFER